MKAISRTVTLTLGAGILLAISVSNAVAGCGDMSSLKGPFQFAVPGGESRQEQPAAQGNTAKFQGLSSPSIVGFWKFQFISKGNTTHNPSIPDGALLDFGYMQWHSDGTELINSAVHSDFCMGVWGQTGYLTFEINHFPINYDPSTGMVASCQCPRARHAFAEWRQLYRDAHHRRVRSNGQPPRSPGRNRRGHTADGGFDHPRRHPLQLNSAGTRKPCPRIARSAPRAVMSL